MAVVSVIVEVLFNRPATEPVGLDAFETTRFLFIAFLVSLSAWVVEESGSGQPAKGIAHKQSSQSLSGAWRPMRESES